MTATRHYCHQTDSSVREAAVTQHRDALFPSIYAETSANQDIVALTEADLTSLTALDLPVITEVNTRKYDVDFTIQVAELGGGANLMAVRIYNGTTGTKADTLVRSVNRLIPASAGGEEIVCAGFRFTPGASNRTKIGLAIVTGGTARVLGAGGNVVSFLRVREVP